MRESTSNVTDEIRRGRTVRVIGLSIVVLVMIAMLALTWRTWPEPVIDFGRELYVPWQLAQGKALYRDVAYFNGPLSPYFNSLIFRVTGARLMSLVIVNIAILAGVVLMFYWLAAKLANDLAATVACCAFLLLLAIGQPGPVGNYNFITPYSHEMTHGLALSLGLIVCFCRFTETRKPRWMASVGALLGLLFLTKPEFFAAAMVAIFIGLWLSARDKRLKSFAICFASGGAVLFAAIALLCLALPLHEAANAAAGGWRWAFDSRITSLPFYQRARGTWNLGESLRALAVTAIGYAVLFGIPATTGYFWRNRKWPRAAQFFVSFCVTVVVLFFAQRFIPPEEIGRPMIVVAMLCTAASAFHIKKATGVLRFVVCLFALLLLGKIALDVRFYHYGFALAAPALVVTIVAVVGWVPDWIDRAGGSGSVLRGASLGAVVVVAGLFVNLDMRTVQAKPVLVGSADDAFYGTPAGNTINGITQILEALPPETNIAVVPEGAMVNYLSRRPNPTPYVVLMPPEVVMFGQPRIIEAFKNHPPDLVLFLQSDATEYGSKGFNIDYGKAIFDWITSSYHPIAQNAANPNMKWLLLQRNN